MGLNWHVNLPGPFGYSRRLGGGSQRSVRLEPWAAAVTAGLFGFALLWHFTGWWGTVPVAVLTAMALWGRHIERRQARTKGAIRAALLTEQVFGVDRPATTPSEPDGPPAPPDPGVPLRDGV